MKTDFSWEITVEMFNSFFFVAKTLIYLPIEKLILKRKSILRNIL